MLRFLYLLFMYLRSHGRLGDLLKDVPEGDDKRALKRRVIKRKLGPWTFLASAVADFDLMADWVFYINDVAEETGTIKVVGLIFACIGSMLWCLIVTEGHWLSEATESPLCADTKLNPMEHLSLKLQLILGIVLEDIPQLIITARVQPWLNSASGAFNVSTAVFSTLAKLVDVLESGGEAPVVAQLRMIDVEPWLMKHLLDKRETAEKEAKMAAKVVVALQGVSSHSEDGHRHLFRALQLAPSWADDIEARFKGQHVIIYAVQSMEQRSIAWSYTSRQDQLTGECYQMAVT